MDSLLPGPVCHAVPAVAKAGSNWDSYGTTEVVPSQNPLETGGLKSCPPKSSCELAGSEVVSSRNRAL